MSETKYIAFDSETEAISYLNPIPDLICLTHAVAGELKGKIKTPWEHPIDATVREWWKEGCHTIGHNVSYDLSILAFKYPELLPDIFAALDADLIHDTMYREKLLNLTRHGALDMLEVNGAVMRIQYRLLDLERKYLNIDRSDLKDDEDAPRLNYYIYKNIPLANWDNGFITYAVDDAINTGLVFQMQENERRICIETTGYDPFIVETFRVRTAFALRLLECVGSCLDGERVKKVTEEFMVEYNKPALRNPLLEAGLLIPGIPPQPYAKGSLEHLPTCIGHKEHPEYVKSRKVTGCGCPPKMKKAEPEHNPTKPLFQYIWKAARANQNIEVWPADAYISKLKQDGVYEDVIGKGEFGTPCFRHTIVAAHEEMPDDVTMQTDAEWIANFAALDPLLAIWAERKALRKIVTDYLPKLYYTDPATGVSEPAKIIRGGFNALVLTGRSSSFTSKLYPSRNEQNVDPRVRPCTIPRPGNVINSTDYAGMELGTLAQRCVNLFGKSVLADKINAGIDTHAFLGAQIAFYMDDTFANTCRELRDAQGTYDLKESCYEAFHFLKGHKEPCTSPTFCEVFRKDHEHDNPPMDRPALWSDFYKHYRTLAKPTGLGYPGGLGPATFISYAKGTYGLTFDLETAKKLRELWLATYPEMGMYLDYVAKNCIDPYHGAEHYVNDDGEEKKRVFFAYDTPRGMHRAKCSFCEAANGQALQAFSAEGALDGLYQVQKAAWLQSDPLFEGVYIINFVHDEIIWECPEDDLIGKRAKALEGIMIACMRQVTPDVKAGAETACMRRWNKKAEGVWDGERLLPWIPPEEKPTLAAVVAAKHQRMWYYHPESEGFVAMTREELEAMSSQLDAGLLSELGPAMTNSESEARTLLEKARIEGRALDTVMVGR